MEITLRSSARLLRAALCLACVPGGLAIAQNDDCLMCHADASLQTERDGRTVSLHVPAEALPNSVHAGLTCTNCHVDLDGVELPHEGPVGPVACGICHDAIESLYEECLHGRAAARGDPLAPSCADCHGAHDIQPIRSRDSAVSPSRVPFVCGKCHREGAPVQRQRAIHQDHILENYSESIHGEGLLKKGLIVTATCASCHTPHSILPHTNPRSSIARGNIAATCTQCHAEIEAVHRKVIRGELWEKEVDVLPACIDCHQPHQARKVFYDQGMADRDCLSCHAKDDIRAADGRSLRVDEAELSHSRHADTACSQCHTGVNPSSRRPCETVAPGVDCSICHAQVVTDYQGSTHGQLFADNDPNAPTCLECHGSHGVLGKLDPQSRTFPTNVPTLCAGCHREGEKAALRYTGDNHAIIKSYTQSIHGKGLLESGLVVTAMCTDCHSTHGELPHTDPSSTVHRDNIPATCGRCHHGIEEKFVTSVHSTRVTTTDKELPVCSDCHTSHTIRRTDEEGFKLQIMDQCGRCHEQIAGTYFDTYHGKVSQLGYTKTAKCYDCHGSHDILPVEDPDSHLSRDNVVATCQKCHPGANRRFAGYLTHATHHDPEKYPWLFWTFWGMTTLLIGTFVVGGLHTLLWIPRALQWRRELKRNGGTAPGPASGDEGEA
jgi:hypothetical protein